MTRVQPLGLEPANLRAVSETVPTPDYDRSRLSVGIVHFGVGGFHRAHQAMYLDRLMNGGEAFDWAICGVGVLEGDRKMQDALDAQGCLYTLIEKHGDGVYTPRVIGSVIAYL
jgi:mannitol 2-dehydrogenase